MGTVTINGKTFSADGNISVTSEGIFVDGVKVNGMTDYNGKEAGKDVIDTSTDSNCSLNIHDVESAVEITGSFGDIIIGNITVG